MCVLKNLALERANAFRKDGFYFEGHDVMAKAPSWELFSMTAICVSAFVDVPSSQYII